MAATDKKRIFVTLTRAYVDAADCLIADGIHFTYSHVVLEALRRLFRDHRIPPFDTAELPPEEVEV